MLKQFNKKVRKKYVDVAAMMDHFEIYKEINSGIVKGRQILQNFSDVETC